MKADFIEKYDRRVPRYTSYPTAPHFSPAVDEAAYRSWLAELPAGGGTSLYIHVPYCAVLCWYCGCHTGVVRGHQPIADYAKLLEKEIGLVAAALKGRLRIDHLHWGGGTPNMLLPEEIAAISLKLREHFDFSANAEISVELDPRALNAETVKAFAASGANRASLGVQDVNPEVQRAINRIQPYEMTAQTVEWLREAGFGGINFDLVYGLPHQTVAGLEETVDTVVRLRPDRVAVFGYAHVPWMRKHQKLLDESILPDMNERIRQNAAVAERLRGHGYVQIGLDHFARPEDPLARSLETGTLHRNFQGYTTDRCDTLIGLGESSISNLPQGYAQNATDITRYRERVNNGHLPIMRGIGFKGEDRLRGDVIERLMCNFAVDLEDAAGRHGATPDIFAAELGRIEILVQDGIVRRDGWRIEVTEEARSFVRAACAVFDTYLNEQGDRHSRIV